jgi:large subunit ribosomal protein L15
MANTDVKVPILSRLAPPEGAVRGKKRVGRGVGSGLGKTAGRGQKGQKARSTGRIGKLYFEGGQMPLQRRLPKIGFANPGAKDVAVVNVRDLSSFAAGAIVDPQSLRDAGLVRTRKQAVGLIKILAQGDIDRALTVRAHAFSEGAKRKIEAAGGTVELLSSVLPRESRARRKSSAEGRSAT